MANAIRAAAAFFSHLGSGTIRFCRYQGKKPIVMPPQTALGEHVEDHRAAFCARPAAEAELDLARREGELRVFLDRADSRVPVRSRGRTQVANTERRFEALAARLLDESAEGRQLQRR